MPTNTERHAEKKKYMHVYTAYEHYKMGPARKEDAKRDVEWAHAAGAITYLDIGCGRGEMLAYARGLGFSATTGAEVVPELCQPDNVLELAVNELATLADASYDLVTCFDVIEHLLPGDDALLVSEMGRLATKCLALTANNNPSIDPTTGANLHINIRSYDEWDQLIREWLGPDWTVTRCTDKQYVSETWRAARC